MVERYFPIDKDYDVDSHLRLYYGPQRDKVLTPFERIKDKDLLIGIIDNRNINPNRLLLLPKDKGQIDIEDPENGEVSTMPYPGKSAFLYLNRNHPSNCNIDYIVRCFLSGKPDRRDFLHLATIKKIEKAGWQAYWTPLQMIGKLEHVRLVSQTTIKQNIDPTIHEAESLKKAFKVVCWDDPNLKTQIEV